MMNINKQCIHRCRRHRFPGLYNEQPSLSLPADQNVPMPSCLNGNLGDGCSDDFVTWRELLGDK